MILTLNAGSSSLKYALFTVECGTLIEEKSATYERIGAGGAASHQEAIVDLLTQLKDVELLRRLVAVGHRVVHGGEAFRAPTLVTPKVEASIASLFPLAPLHNPANLEGIRSARVALAKAGVDVPHVAVFDTAFHATLPPVAYRYAVPEAWYRQYHVRRYGFHGTSHSYVSEQARQVLAKADRPSAKMITLHLGNGCSAAAVYDGQCIDTSMGLTPLAGLMMGTRSGDLDPGLPAYLLGQGIELAAQDHLLNRESGLKGIGGDNDVRTLLTARQAGSRSAKLALDMFVYRIRKQIGAYVAALGGLEALVFTAGIGENSVDIRREVCAGLHAFGIDVDESLNQLPSDEPRCISKGTCSVLVLPTNEELALAQAALTATQAPLS